MAALGTFHAWSVLVQPLQDELDASRSTVSAVYALATAVFAASMLLEPAAHRRFPAVVLGAGSALLAAAGLALAAIPSEAAVFVGYGVLFAVANGIGYGLAVHIAATVGRTGATAGYMVAAYALGGTIVAPLLSVAARDAGVEAAFLGLAAAMVVVAAVQVRVLGPAEPHLSRPAGGAAVSWGVLGRDRVFWLLWLGFLFGSAAGLVVIGHGAAIVSSLGGGAAALTLGASLAAGGNGVGRLGGGRLADRVSVRTVLIAGSVLAAVVALRPRRRPRARGRRRRPGGLRDRVRRPRGRLPRRLGALLRRRTARPACTRGSSPPGASPASPPRSPRARCTTGPAATGRCS